MLLKDHRKRLCCAPEPGNRSSQMNPDLRDPKDVGEDEHENHNLVKLGTHIGRNMQSRERNQSKAWNGEHE